MPAQVCALAKSHKRASKGLYFTIASDQRPHHSRQNHGHDAGQEYRMKVAWETEGFKTRLRKMHLQAALLPC